MSKLREERVARYSKPLDWVSGISTDESNLKYWSGRAETNSAIAPRAKGGKMDLPSTGNVKMRSTASKPRGIAADPYPAAKADLNHDLAATMYMRGVRRDA
jgi:hypothetical protein